jgi:hypothetical protein
LGTDALIHSTEFRLTRRQFGRPGLRSEFWDERTLTSAKSEFGVFCIWKPGSDRLRTAILPFSLSFAPQQTKTAATNPAPQSCFGIRTVLVMAHWSDELRIDPVVWATVLFGVLAAAVLVTAV